MNTPYLEDIPLETAQNEFRTFLRSNNLLNVIGDQVIPLDEDAGNRVLSTSIYSPESSPTLSSKDAELLWHQKTPLSHLSV